MFKIVGSRTEHEYGYGGYTGKKTDETEDIATFDDEKMAHQYIEKSRLKAPINRERPFRQTSLLVNYEHADVELVGEHYLPHNPKI